MPPPRPRRHYVFELSVCPSIVVKEDRLYHWKINCIIRGSTVSLVDQLLCWKINCSVERSTVLLEDQLYYWKINCDVGRYVVLLEDQLYWRRSTGIDGNYQWRKITMRRWLHNYVGAECGASNFTWYLYQICNTDICLSGARNTLFPPAHGSFGASNKPWPFCGMMHADVCWPPPELISLWSWSVDFSNFGTILT